MHFYVSSNIFAVFYVLMNKQLHFNFKPLINKIVIKDF